MKLFGEEVRHTSTNSPLNVLQVENFDEIFFDVFEVELNDTKLPLEKISSYKGNPVVNLPIVVEGEEVSYPFVLVKGTPEILFHESNTSLPIDDEPFLLEYEDKEEILSESKQEILEQIEKAKNQATRAIKATKLLEATQLSETAKKNNKALRNILEKARENLVEEFITVSNKIREELVNESRQGYSEMKETLDNKLVDICENLEFQLKDNFKDASKIFDNNIKTLVKELYSETVYPKLEKDLNDIAFQIVEKVGEIETTLDKKLDTKAEKTLVESVSNELSAIQKANIELNDNINKGVNKALSRAGNVKTLVEKIDKEINEKISTELTNIENYFDERIQNIQEKTFDVTEESRKYLIDLVNKSKKDLLEEIAKIPKEKPVEYIIESKSKDPEKVNLDKLKKEYDTIIHNKFENYKTDLRKYIAVYSGGGSVAQQFADGGVMNGDLTVIGTISASNYLGIPNNGVSGDYLPLSGGTLSGDLFIQGDLTSVDSIQFDTLAGVGVQEGQIAWDNTDGTLNIGLKGGNVTLQVGQEEVIRVVNKTGDDLLESEFKVVRVRSVDEGGAQGQRLAVVLAKADNDMDSATTLGIVTENISNNQEGFITTFGEVRGINTKNVNGEVWEDGDMIYLSPSDLGYLTNIKPQAPNHTVIMGYVVYAHTNNGKIFVKVDNGYELDELHNVRITSPQNNDILKYNSLSGVWENGSSSSDYLPLSGGTVTGSISAQSLSASSANIQNGFIVDNNTFVVDSVNDRVGIGTTTPSQKLHVVGNSIIQGTLSSGPIGIGTSPNTQFQLDVNQGTRAGFRFTSGTRNISFAAFEGDTNYMDSTGSALRIRTLDSNSIQFFTNNDRKMGINPSGNVYIGAASDTHKLDVNGSFNVVGDATLNGTTTTSTLLANTSISTPSLSTSVNGLGSNTTNAITLVNSTSAAAGAQQVSPAIRWQGQGWKTNATASSQPVEFRAYVLPVQGTASPSARWVLERSINNAPFSTSISVDVDGNIFGGGVRGSGACVYSTSNNSSNGIELGASTVFGWSGGATSQANTQSIDTILYRAAAANIRQGRSDAAAPVAQTSSVQNVATGTSNTAGANRTYAGSQGTGTGKGGAHIFTIAPAAALSGTSQNALVEAFRVDGNGNVGINTSTPSYTLDVNGTFNVVGNATFSGTITGLSVGDTDNAILRADGAGKLQGSSLTIEDAITAFSILSGNASDDFITTATPHNFVDGDYVRFQAITGGSGLSVGTNYWIVSADIPNSRFKVSTTSGGAAVNFTTNITAGTICKGGRPEVALVKTLNGITDYLHFTQGGGLYRGPYADGTTIGRNTRGYGAIDFSSGGSTNAQIASGDYSFQAASQSTTTSGNSSVALACNGGNQSVSGAGCVLMASNWTNGIGGYNNVAMAVNFASSSSNSGNCVIMAGGGYVTGSSSRCVLIGQATSNGRNDGIFHGGVDFDNSRNTQHYAIPFTCKTTSSSAVELLAYGSQRFFIENNKTYAGTINIQGIESNGLKTAHYIRQFSVSSMSRTVSAVNTDPTAETITFSRDHNFNLNDPIVFSTTGAVIGGLTNNTTYYVVNVVNSTTIQVGLTVGGAAINLTGAGTGTRTFTYTRMNYTPVPIGADFASGTTLSITTISGNLIMSVSGVDGETWRWQAYIEGVEMVAGI